MTLISVQVLLGQLFSKTGCLAAATSVWVRWAKYKKTQPHDRVEKTGGESGNSWNNLDIVEEGARAFPKSYIGDSRTCHANLHRRQN